MSRTERQVMAWIHDALSDGPISSTPDNELEVDEIVEQPQLQIVETETTEESEPPAWFEFQWIRF